MGLSLGLGMLASTTGVPELAIDDVEATAVTKAIAKLARYYDLSAGGAAGAWMGLVGTVGPIVGARYLAYRMRVSGAGGASSGPQRAFPGATGQQPGPVSAVGIQAVPA